MVVVLAVLNSKVLLAEISRARRELDRNGVQFSHTENTRKLCPCVLENTMLAYIMQLACTVILSVLECYAGTQLC